MRRAVIGGFALALVGVLVAVFDVFQMSEPVARPRQLTPEETKSVRVSVEVRPRLLVVRVNGELVADLHYAAGALRGGIGLLVTDSGAEFDDLRLSY